MKDYQPIINDSVRDGPVEHRKCTDLFCCLVFTAFVIAFFTVGIVGFTKGDPELLIYPFDSSGHQCGRPNRDTHDYQYVYYAAANKQDDVSDYKKYRICLKHCPKGNGESLEYHNNDYVAYIEKEKKFAIKAGDEIVFSKPYDSDSLWKRFCIPDHGEDYFDDVLDDVYEIGAQSWISDIYRSWSAMFIVLGLSIGFSIIYLILLRYCAGVVVWATIIATFVIMILFGVYIEKVAHEKYSSHKDRKTRHGLETFAIIIFVCIAIFFLIVLFMFRRIRLAVAVLKSGSIFLKDVPSILFVPIVIFLLSFAFYTYWITALIYIYSSGHIKDHDSAVSKMDWDKSTRHSLYFEVLGVVWINSIKIAFTQFIIACTVGIWYFSREKAGYKAILTSTFYSVRYHLGSLAFGSLLLSVIRWIKFALWYLKEKVFKEAYEGNCLVRMGCKCVGCYVDCFERFVKFIDKHAYIQIALTGESFCEAAKNAFSMIVENSARFAALGALGDIFSVLGKIFITFFTTYVGFLIVTHVEHYKEKLQSPIAPTCVFALISYTVAGVFMSVFEMTCDTIIQAFLIDEHLHKGPAVFAPEPLKEFMKEHKDQEHKSYCCGCL
jgi:hypothetical protein